MPALSSSRGGLQLCGGAGRTRYVYRIICVHFILQEIFSIGLVQFVDLNPDVSAFQRQFVSEVKRCEEMERILRYVETEIVREKIEVAEAREETIAAPAPREMVELESELRRRLEIEADNAKLKQENAALIRIISKLSK